MIFSKRDEVCGRSQGTRDENAYGKIAEQRNFLRSRSYTARQKSLAITQYRKVGRLMHNPFSQSY
jgi:hypothetical protein